MSVFGPIIERAKIEEAVMETLQYWFGSYLEEVELQSGIANERNKTPKPKSWIRVNELDKFPEEILPCVIVISPGLSDSPTQEGSGIINAPFGVGVAVVASAIDQESTRDLVGRYCAVIRAILLQNGSLQGIVPTRGTVWEDESYDDLTVEDERTLGVGQVTFTVWVEGVVDRLKGPGPLMPADEDTLPGTEWPEVEEVTVTIDRKP
jgi:hypothetical protein